MKDGTDKIIKQIGENFAEETLSLINIDLNRYKQDIDEILGKLKRWNKRLSNVNKELYLKEAYQKIMEFRTFLLGKENEIQYRLYIRDKKEDDLAKVQIINLNEKQLMKVVGRDRDSLRLRQNLQLAIDDQAKDFKRQQIFNTHMENIKTGFEHPSGSPSNYVVTKNVINLYFENKKFLNNIAYLQDTGEIARLKLFNRGWIYQAFDSTVEDLDSQNYDLNEDTAIIKQLFHKHYFTESLSYDNLVGFKGGDVGLTQIKANAAALMSKTTLVKYLTIIQDALNQKIKGQDSKSSEELTKYLVSQFKEGEIEDSVYNYAAKQIQNLTAKLTN